jgi:hypothetical protein
LSEAEYETLIDETERRMLGLPLPGSVNDVKLGQDPDLRGGALMRIDQKALRAFRLVHGRAPSAVELAAFRLRVHRKEKNHG